jgi:pimeloyl-ACP methyl ester carboxylesterase
MPPPHFLPAGRKCLPATAARPPLLIIRGEHSDTFHPPAMRQVLARVPKAQIVTVPDAGHLAPMEKPEEVARLIHEFL